VPANEIDADSLDATGKAERVSLCPLKYTRRWESALEKDGIPHPLRSNRPNSANQPHPQFLLSRCKIACSFGEYIKRTKKNQSENQRRVPMREIAFVRIER
jgi:hypothetical protein